MSEHKDEKNPKKKEKSTHARTDDARTNNKHDQQRTRPRKSGRSNPHERTSLCGWSGRKSIRLETRLQESMKFSLLRREANASTQRRRAKDERLAATLNTRTAASSVAGCGLRPVA